MPEGRRPRGHSLARRDVRLRRQAGQGKQGREIPEGHIEEQIGHSHGHRWRKASDNAALDIETIEEENARGDGGPHKAGLDPHPRRRQLPFASGGAPQSQGRGPQNRRDQRPQRQREPHGPHKRRAFAVQEIHEDAWRILESRSPGVVRPFLVHMVGAEQPHGQGQKVPRNGRFDAQENQIQGCFREKGR